MTRREALIWTIGFLVVSALLVLTGFTSNDPDSGLYAGLSARLAHEPPARWIAPEWWGLWPRLEGTGLYRDHPIGGFMLPVLIAQLGVPGEQAAYIVGVGTGLAALILIARIVNRLASREAARAVLLLLQLMPVAFVFRIRANQEYLMLVWLIVAVIGVDIARRSWWGVGVVAAAFSAAVVTKGAFVLFTIEGAALWALCNPARVRGSLRGPLIAGVAGLVAICGTAFLYDTWYAAVTGGSFWRPYWDLQMGQVEVATPVNGATTLADHLLFYLVRLLWHPAPWSLVLIGLAWQTRGAWVAAWRTAPPSVRWGLTFAVAYAVTLVVTLIPSSRVAERYIFSGTYAVATAGIVALCRTWPQVQRRLTTLDERVPALPALVWTGLMLLRLALGPLVPRIQL